jgi:chromosome segregation ATPase
MKALLLPLCAFLLVSCGGRSPLPPSAPVTPPTVPPLAEVERPSVRTAVPLARESVRAIERARSENERLRDHVAEAEEVNKNLGQLLAESIEDGSASKERLLEIENLVKVEKSINEAFRVTVERLVVINTGLHKTAAELEDEISRLGEQIAVANQRLDDTTDQLIQANSRINGLTTAYNDAVANAGEWKDAAATATGKIETEQTWKWRFFWWAVVATGLILGYIGLRLHPTTRLLIP